MNSRPLVTFLLLFFSLLVFLPGVATLPVTDRDEARFAQATAQMVESGDYIDIEFQQQKRYQKPIGIYWLQSLSLNLLGAEREIWRHRTVSLVSAVLSVLLTSLLGSILFNRAVGIAAGFILASTLLLNGEARLAKTDAALLLFITLAEVVVAKLYLASSRISSQGEEWALFFVFWLSLTAGVYIKGPVVLLILGLTLLTLAVLDRNLGVIKGLKLPLGIMILVGLMAPWFIQITLMSEGQFLMDSLGVDFLDKLVEVRETHGAPPGFYFGFLWLGFFPFSLLLARGLGIALFEKKSRSHHFLLAWIIPAWIVLEGVTTKLPHYILPLFPPLAVIAATVLYQPFRRSPGLFRAGLSGLLITLAVVGSVAVVGAPSLLIWWMTDQLPKFTILWVALAGLGGIGISLLLFFRQQWVGLVVFLCLLAVGHHLFVFRSFLPGIEALWVTRQIATTLEDHPVDCEAYPVLSVGYHEPSLVYTLGTQIRLVNPAQLEAQLDKPECALVMTTDPETVKRREGQKEIKQIGRVSGLNYSNGRWVELQLLEVKTPSNP